MKRIITGIRILLASSILMYCMYSVYYFTVNKSHPTYKDSGIIESKSSDEVVIKHGHSTELYLNVRFDKSGFKSIEVSPTTYFKYKVGERIYADLNSERPQLFPFLLGLVIVFVVFCIIIFFTLSLVIMGNFPKPFKINI